MSDEREKLHKGHGSEPDFQAHKLHKGHGSEPAANDGAESDDFEAHKLHKGHGI